MLHISLFSGIGGFDLAAQWAGWDTVLTCEVDPLKRKVLQYYWPHAYHHPDVKTLTKKIVLKQLKNYEQQKIIISAGFPCQPFSVAGKRKGSTDNRYLWPDTYRVIKEIRPDWVVLENVAGLTSMVFPEDAVQVGGQEDLFGKTDKVYEKQQQFVLYRIINDLNQAGYSVQTYIIPAAAVGAPHRRDRIWIVSYTESQQSQRHESTEQVISQQKQEQSGRGGSRMDDRLTTNTNQKRLQRSKRGKPSTKRNRPKTSGSATKRIEIPTWDRWPIKSPVCGGDDGVPSRLDGITVSTWRKKCLESFGEAIVPQVAYVIYQTINNVEKWIE